MTQHIAKCALPEITYFIWDNKPATTNLDIAQNLTGEGGLPVPNIKLNYYVSVTGWLIDSNLEENTIL